MASTKDMMEALQGKRLFKEALSKATDTLMREFRSEIEDNANHKYELLRSSGFEQHKLEFTTQGIGYKTSKGVKHNATNMASARGAAYCFLNAMMDQAAVRMPLVADSPFAGMGPIVVWKLWRHVIQNFHQTILLLQAGEKRNLLFNDHQINIVLTESATTSTFIRNGEDIDGNYTDQQNQKIMINTDPNWFVNYVANSQGV